MKEIIDRLLQERLEQFDVPIEIRNAISGEIMNALERPERKPSGAVFMSPEASAAADRARVNKTPIGPEGRPTQM